METPIRVQRKRVKGWRMPENTINVTRPGRWGNPFKIGNYYRIGRTGFMSPCHPDTIAEAKNDGVHVFVSDNKIAVELYEKYLKQLMFPPPIKQELKGKNLACFCALDQPCHADVLIRIANEK